MKLINANDDSIETIGSVYGYSKIPDKVIYHLLIIRREARVRVKVRLVTPYQVLPEEFGFQIYFSYIKA